MRRRQGRNWSSGIWAALQAAVLPDGPEPPVTGVAPATAPAVFGLEHEHGVWLSPDATLLGTTPAAAVLGELRVGLRAGTGYADQFLENGARVYVDANDHLEYATPECSRLREVLAADAAGQRLLAAAARAVRGRLTEAAGRPIDVRVLRANVAPGTSWGCHENYLVPAHLAWEMVGTGVASHLATRIVWAGSGGMAGPCAGWPRFRLSPRAMFTGKVLAPSAMGAETAKPMILVREEPLADPRRFRRVQVVCGDASMSETAEFLKIGTTGLVLRLLERGVAPPVRLDDPVHALHVFSEDLSLHATVPSTRGEVRALDVQWLWLEAAQAWVAQGHGGPDDVEVVRTWGRVLADLERDVSLAGDRVDWVAKLALLDRLRAREGSWMHPAVLAADLLYHDVDPQRSLAHRIASRGGLQHLIDTDAIARACTDPPTTTRAARRGALIRWARSRGVAYDVSWDRFQSYGRGCQLTVDLPDPLDTGAELVASLTGADAPVPQPA